MILRSATFIMGLALLAATAHVTIAHAGGYGSPHAVLTIAIATGVGVAALAIGSAWANQRRPLAIWLAVAILAGEAFGFLMTAERLIVGREAAQAPLRAAEQAHAKASARVAHAAAVLAATPETSARLDAAVAAKASADQAATDKSVERGCRENCRQLLQAQVDAAEREVVAARADLAARKQSAADDLAAARSALEKLKAPASATPLADRTGIAAWVIDLFTAALGSMAANGLGCGLIAFTSHGRRREGDAPPVVIEAVASQAIDDRAIPAHEHARRFAFERIWPGPQGGGTDVLAIQAAYHSWCAGRGLAPLSGADLGRALADLFEGVGIPVAERDGRMVALGVALKPERQPLDVTRLIADERPDRRARRLGPMAKGLAKSFDVHVRGRASGGPIPACTLPMRAKAP